MERLEAAMAKAREARRKARREAGLPEDGPDAPAGVSAAAETRAAPRTAPRADWLALREIDIPPRTVRRSRLGALQGSRAAIPYDMLRARLLRRMRDAGWQRLAVTSPNAGCGKSTLSLNLALSLARQPDLRVILFDCDLRRPGLARMLQLPGQASMADLLNGDADFAEHALRFGTNLAIAPGHRPVAQSSELLRGPQVAATLDRIAAEWAPDVMIFDMPPLQGNDDVLAFIDRVDCAMLVAAAESTTISQIDVCERELSGMTNVVGTVLNKCRYPDSEAGYGRGYY